MSALLWANRQVGLWLACYLFFCMDMPEHYCQVLCNTLDTRVMPICLDRQQYTKNGIRHDSVSPSLVHLNSVSKHSGWGSCWVFSLSSLRSIFGYVWSETPKLKKMQMGLMEASSRALPPSNSAIISSIYTTARATQGRTTLIRPRME